MNCEQCGAKLETKIFKIDDFVMDVPKTCKCQEKSKIEQEHSDIKTGMPIMRNLWCRMCGLKARQCKQTFDEFNATQSQNKALQTMRRFCEEFPHNSKGVLLVGGVGCGKTHLAAAAMNWMVDNWLVNIEDCKNAVYNNMEFKYNRSRYKFITSIELLEKIRASFDNSENTQDIVKDYAQAKLLILDDLGAEKSTDWAMERLFEIIDHRYNELLPTVITSNYTPKQLTDRLGERITDRIREMCKVEIIQEKSQRKTAE